MRRVSQQNIPLQKKVCNIGTNPQAVTSPREPTITVIASENAIGSSIPP